MNFTYSFEEFLTGLNMKCTYSFEEFLTAKHELHLTPPLFLETVAA
jgi:hypothetical protein